MKTLPLRMQPALLLAVLALVVACSADPESPRGTAERFLDAHYVLIDLPAALPVTSGVARHKLQREIDLTRGQAIDADTQKPTVHYSLVEEHPEGGNAARFLYLTRITAGGDRFERKVMVTVRQEPEGWRVTNWEEFNP